jgi:SAM-dependent methyltransferase
MSPSGHLECAAPEAGAEVQVLPPSLELEEPACTLCGSRRTTPFIWAGDNSTPAVGPKFCVVRCLDCGLCFTSPRPTLAAIGAYYPAHYSPYRTPSRPKPVSRRSRLAAWCGWALNPRRALPWNGQGRLLDFGCGGGAFLECMHRQGWSVTGVDASGVAVERVRSGLGLRALLGTLPHPDLQPASFDVLTMWASLEHVHDPLAVLRAAHRLLAPGGKLLIAVPNIDSLPFRWFGPAWYGLDLPRHLTHFTPRTLRLMLERAGFEAGRVRMVRHSGWLRLSARQARRLDPATRWPSWLTNKPLSRLVTLYSSWTRQADSMLVTARR